MAKRRKAKSASKSNVQEQLANTLKTLRTLRVWEDHLINELERLCAQARRRPRS